MLLIEACLSRLFGAVWTNPELSGLAHPYPLIVELAVPLMCVGASRIKANAAMPLRR